MPQLERMEQAHHTTRGTRVKTKVTEERAAIYSNGQLAC